MPSGMELRDRKQKAVPGGEPLLPAYSVFRLPAFEADGAGIAAVQKVRGEADLRRRRADRVLARGRGGGEEFVDCRNASVAWSSCLNQLIQRGCLDRSSGSSFRRT